MPGRASCRSKVQSSDWSPVLEIVKEALLLPPSSAEALILTGATSIAGSVPAAPQVLTGEPELRGLGAALLKSAALSSVSVQPSSARNAASVLEIAGAVPLPSWQLAEP